MSSDIQIKKLEFDFDIADNKYHNYIFNLISGKVNSEFNEIITKVAKEHELLISSNNLSIDKIEIDLNEIYVQELDKLFSIIEKHLEIKFQEIFNNVDVFTQPLIFDDILSYYVSNKIFPWWINSNNLRNNFLVKQNLKIKNNYNVLKLITKDFLSFRKIFDLFNEDERLSFLKKLLGKKYFLFEKILLFKKETYNSFNLDSSKVNLEYLIFRSVQQASTSNNRITFTDVLRDEFSENNIESEQLFRYYDEYKAIINGYKNNLSRRSYGTKEIPKNLNYQSTLEISYYSYLKRNFNLVNTENLEVLFKWVVKKYPKKFKSEKEFLNDLFSDKHFFLDLLFGFKDPQLIVLISKLSLLESKKDQVSTLLKKISSNIIEAENSFLSYQTIIGLVKENETFIKHFVRFTFLKSYSQNQEFKFNKKEFIYQLLLDLVRSGKLEKKSIINYLNTGAIVNAEINEILSSLVSTYHYKQITQVSRTKIYYKDLYYHFLYYEEIPSWSNRENISEIEILNFFEILVRKKEIKFLKFLGENILIKNNVLSIMDKSLNLFTDLFYMLAEFSLDLNKKEYAWIKNNKTIHSWIIQEIFQKKLWKLKSTSSLFMELIKNIESENIYVVKKESTISQLYSALSYELNVNEISSFLKHLLEKSKGELSLQSDNIIKSKNYSSILLELPVHDLIIVLSNINPAKGRKNPIIENTLLSKIIKYFKTNKKLLHYYLTYFKNDFVSIHFLKQLFSLSNIIEILNLKFKTEKLENIFFKIFEDFYSTKNSTKDNYIDFLSFLSNIKTFTSYEIFDLIAFNIDSTKLDDKKLLSYIDGIDVVQIDLSKLTEEQIKVSLKKLRQKGELMYFRNKFSSISAISYHQKMLKKLFSRVSAITKFSSKTLKPLKSNIKQYSEILERNFNSKKFDVLNYYIEFGSFPYDNQDMTLTDLKNVFVSMYHQNIFQFRKHLFNWAKSESRLDRFMKIYYLDSIAVNKDVKKSSLINFEKILSVVYTGLLKDLSFFISLSANLNILKSSSIYNSIKIDFKSKSTKQVQINKLLLKKILIFWAKYKYSFKDSSSFLIQVFYDEINFPEKVFELQKITLSKKEKFPVIKNTFFLRKTVDNLNQIIKSKSGDKNEVKKLTTLNEELEQGIVIYNSGLLLFWPFLKTLFIKLELLNPNKNGYKEEISKDKAVMATDYLVNGEFSKEKNFLLNKILCGIELEREIDSTVDLSDFEKAICDSAIKALLSNWKKIKSTQTLRDWFLIREGRLIEKENSFVLDVENKPPDVFLKQLSWGISMINYDLMIKKLVVNWKY